MTMAFEVSWLGGGKVSWGCLNGWVLRECRGLGVGRGGLGGEKGWMWSDVEGREGRREKESRGTRDENGRRSWVVLSRLGLRTAERMVGRLRLREMRDRRPNKQLSMGMTWKKWRNREEKGRDSHTQIKVCASPRQVGGRYPVSISPVESTMPRHIIKHEKKNPCLAFKISALARPQRKPAHYNYQSFSLKKRKKNKPLCPAENPFRRLREQKQAQSPNKSTKASHQSAS